MVTLLPAFDNDALDFELALCKACEGAEAVTSMRIFLSLCGLSFRS